MTSIPPNVSRIPSLMASNLIRANVNNTNLSLFGVQNQLATGLRINRVSDDPIGASIVSVLDDRLETSQQVLRNMQHGSSVMGAIDNALGSFNAMILEAKQIASSQIGITSDPETRAAQAEVINSMIQEAMALANGSVDGVHYFGGSRTRHAPFEAFHEGFRYLGQGSGLRTDLGAGVDFPITVGGDFALGAVSARVDGDIDLDPQLRPETRLADLRGPAANFSLGGSVTATIDTGAPDPTVVVVDLTGAETVGDVTAALESAIRDAAPGSLAGAYPGGVTTAGDRFQFNVAAGVTIRFDDGPAGSTARALGIADFDFDAGNAVQAGAEYDLDPRLADNVTFGSLDPTNPVDFGTLRITNGGRSAEIDITPGMTIGEFKEAVAALEIGARVELDDSGDTLNVVNEISGWRLQVEELGGFTATSLGIRNIRATTELSIFNDGRGVQIAHGETLPDGSPDVDRNVDFDIVLGDGSTFTVDLEPDDVVSVDTVLTAINQAANAAGFGPVFQAVLTQNDNGITLKDTTGGPDPIRVVNRNGYAAEDLGLLDGEFRPGGPGIAADLVGEDRASVRVDSIFTDLIDLRDALLNDDDIGISIAGERLDERVNSLATARATVGGRASRLESAALRLEDTNLLDDTMRSSLRDLDYVEASSRFSLLQVQLQAGLQSAARIRSLSLLDFLG